MAGNQCSDFGGTNVPSTLLCLMPQGHPYAGLVTYRDGRVAAPGPETPVGANADLNRRMQGTEIGDCGVAGPSSVYLPLQTVAADGTRITWEPEHLRALYRAMNQGRTESGNALFCSNRETGGLAINRYAGDKIRNAINALQADHSGFDEAHYRIALQQLQQMGGVTEAHRSPSWFEWLLFGVFAYHPVSDLLKFVFRRRDPPDRPTGGGENGSRRNGGGEPTRTEPPAGAQNQAMVAMDPELAAGLSVLDESYGLVPDGAASGVRTYLTLDDVRVDGTAPMGFGGFAIPGLGIIRLPNLAPLFEGAPLPGLRLAPRLR